MKTQMTFQNVLDDVGQYVRHQIEEGVLEADVSPDILDGVVAGTPPRSAPPAGLPRGTGIPPARRSREAKAAARPTKTDSPGDTGLQTIARQVAGCKKCALHKSRTKSVPGQGAAAPAIMFIGEAPGSEEDRQGLAFVGRAGQLLTRMIEAMGFTRDEIFIGNILKCRPPGNRAPLPEEMQTCLPYLKEQIALLHPKVIVALGGTAARGLLDTQIGITKLRGRWMSFEGIDLMPTFHPAYLLRNPAAKHDAWEDLKSVLERLGKKPPARKKSKGRTANEP